MSLPLITHVWKAALRDKLILSIIVLIALSTSLSIFLASAAITEKDQFAAVFTAGSLRLLGVIGLCIFVIFFIRRSMDAKDIEFLLSRPISRIQFVLSYAFSFSCLALLLAFACSAALFAISPHLIGAGHFIWAASIMIEYVIMVNVAFVFALMLSSASTAVLSVLAFYVLARMMGQILGIVDSGIAAGASYMQGLEMILQAVSVVTPRLDLLGQTSWLLYDIENMNDLLWIAIQTCVFLALVLCAGLFDLIKRQF